jgi:thiamine-monophosphate kinase
VALDELSIIERFFRPLAGEGAFGLLDDAALLDVPPGCDIVVTTDMIAAGIHFLADDPPDTVARKALRVNLSDLAAKGATPVAYALGIGLGPDMDADWLDGFAAGLKRDQETFGLRLLGGDTIAVPAGPVVSVTAFGCAPKARMVHRFGGRPGDLLYVSGCIGAAAAGLSLLTRAPGPWDALPPTARDALIQHFRVPEPRVALAAALAQYASAAMDISDGLAGDCDKLAAASGCTATIEAERVPLPSGLEGADETLLATLLSGGDDYEILAAVLPRNSTAFEAAADAVKIPVTRIGALREGEGRTEVLSAGRPLPLYRRSFVHGRDPKA